MNFYAAFLAATLGADDFDTRDRWTDVLKSSPLLKLVAYPALWDKDPEVNYRARLITRVTLPEWAHKAEDVKTVIDLVGDPYDWRQIGRLAVVYGDSRNGGVPGYRIERLARTLGLVPPGCVMPWGTDYARRWITWCRAKHHGLNPEGSPCTAAKLELPIPMPKEKP